MLNSRPYTILIALLILACAVPALAQTVAPKQDEPKLIAVLQDAGASQKDKIDACRKLAIIGGKDSIAPLAALLGDEKLSHNARYALEPNPDPAVDAALRDALGKVKGRPLVGVITSLGVRRDAGAVGPLAGFLKNSDNDVVQATARALGRIGNDAAAAELFKTLDSAAEANRLAFYEGLFRCAESPGTTTRRNIYARLQGIESAPHHVRAGALRGAILACEGGEQIGILKQQLQNKDYIQFSTAVQVMQQMPAEAVTGLMTDALSGEPKLAPADRQILVIGALGVRHDAKALPTLFTMARSGDKPVRLAAVQAITEIGNGSAVPVLVQLLDDPDKEIAGTAQECLAALPGTEADAAILSMFKGQDAAKRKLAVNMMERRRLTGSAAMLLGAARDATAEVRPSLIKAAGEMATTEQVPALLDLLNRSETQDDLSAVEQALMTACPKAADSNAMAALLSAASGKAKPPQKVVLLRVQAAVGGPEALKAVLASLGDTNADVRAAAVRALSTWKSPDAAPHQLTLAKETKDPGERTLALRGYLGFAGRGDMPVEDRLAMVRQATGVVQGDGEKKLLLGALGNTGSPDALSLIAAHLDNAGTREEAASAVIAVTEKLLKDPGGRTYPPVVAESLEKVTQSGAREDIVNRAKALLKKVKGDAQ